MVPRQVVGCSASLIPFVAHDEANRALMGSHMQCQAVPLVKTQAPIVGTGMEKEIATAMGWTVLAEFPGEVLYVDASEVVLKVDAKYQEKAKAWVETANNERVSYQQGNLTYKLNKFARTSQSTCYNQTPEVQVGDKIKKGDVLIDGPATDHGELALGTNLLIAYTCFKGLGYESYCDF